MAPVNSNPPPPTPARLTPTVLAFTQIDRGGVLAKYCVTCHNERTKTGGLALDVVARGSVRDHAPVWEDVLHKLRAGAMPPPGMPRPDAAATTALISALATELDTAPRDPGRPLLRRLNRAEYGNVIRDLLAIEVDVRSLLPRRRLGVRLRQQRRSAGRLAGAARAVSRRGRHGQRAGCRRSGDGARGRQLTSRAAISRRASIRTACRSAPSAASASATTSRSTASISFRSALIRTNTEGIRGLEHPHQLEITVDGERVFLGTVGGEADSGQTGQVTARSDATDARLRARVPVKAGARLVSAAWIRKIGEGTNRLRPFLRSNAGTYDSTGRPHVKFLTIAGPFNPTGPGDTPSRRRIFSCHPAGPARSATGLAAEPAVQRRRRARGAS